MCKIAGFLMAFSANLISFDPTLVLPTPFLCLPGSASASSTPFPPLHHRCVHYYPPLPLFLKGLLWFILVCSEFSFGQAQIRTDAVMAGMCQGRPQILQCPLLPICWQHGQQISLLSSAVLLAVHRINILNIM